MKVMVTYSSGLQSSPGRSSTASPLQGGGGRDKIAVAALEKDKSAVVDNIPAELVQAGGGTMIDIFDKDLETKTMADTMISVVDYYTP